VLILLRGEAYKVGHEAPTDTGAGDKNIGAMAGRV
jgi:hypothetical protein